MVSNLSLTPVPNRTHSSSPCGTGRSFRRAWITHLLVLAVIGLHQERGQAMTLVLTGLSSSSVDSTIVASTTENLPVTQLDRWNTHHEPENSPNEAAPESDLGEPDALRQALLWSYNTATLARSRSTLMQTSKSALSQSLLPAASPTQNLTLAPSLENRTAAQHPSSLTNSVSDRPLGANAQPRQAALLGDDTEFSVSALQLAITQSDTASNLVVGLGSALCIVGAVRLLTKLLLESS
ncbi:hypothetical protein H6F43_14300 [Leptolyngbya sp. FACHB-36]|uniref:hypothetical protein n=1 Tax=Leptolyngbya sp. FACHB-36 TaxID=2692808 RepID=UPI0016819D34|nr:hypothetical protein [Leptolyngbya sp. FACHB-36]MBD2021348.1 hypothetical protein [Leptolyngbya sp. FACHB-36]